MSPSSEIEPDVVPTDAPQFAPQLHVTVALLSTVTDPTGQTDSIVGMRLTTIKMDTRRASARAGLRIAIKVCIFNINQRHRAAILVARAAGPGQPPLATQRA